MFYYEISWFYQDFRSENLCPLNMYSVHARSSRLEVFCRKAVLRNFAKFTGKHLCQSLFFNKP